MLDTTTFFEDKKNYLEEHFIYEVEMLCFSFARIIDSKQIDEEPAQYSLHSTSISTPWVAQHGEQANDANNINMALETFLLHARNLKEFFYNDNKRYDTDARAWDFLEDKNLWQKLRPAEMGSMIQIRKRAGKELAHLSYKRIYGTPPEKNWNIGEILSELLKVVDIFLDHLSPKYFGDRLQNLKQRIKLQCNLMTQKGK